MAEVIPQDQDVEELFPYVCGFVRAFGYFVDTCGCEHI